LRNQLFYYILFYIDYQLAIVESNENNNKKFLPVTITPPNLPDARIQGATVNPSNCLSGETVTLSSNLQNIGAEVLTTCTLNYYLSPTPTYDSTTAVFLNNTSVSNLSAGYYINKTDDVLIPTNTTTGNYYILFYADASHSVAESNENNNVSAVAITVTTALADFRIVNSSAVYVNGNVEVSAWVMNIGALASGATTLGYFLSTDNLYDSGDVLLGTDSISSLAPSGLIIQDGAFPIAANTTNGLYYILFVADYLEVEQEGDETNNTASKEVVITINVNRLPSAELLFYPNPTLQSVAVELGRVYEDVQVQVYNPLGQLIQITEPQTTANLSLDLEGPTGIYLLQITTKEGVFEGIPIVKE